MIKTDITVKLYSSSVYRFEIDGQVHSAEKKDEKGPIWLIHVSQSSKGGGVRAAAVVINCG